MKREELARAWRTASHGSSGGGQAAADHDAGMSSGAGLMGLPMVSEAAGLAGSMLAVLGLAIDGWAEAPAALRASSATYAGWASSLGLGAGGARAVDYGDVAVDSGDLGTTFVRAHERLADIVAGGATPLVLGGDRLVSVPVLQVLSGKLHGKLGVIAFCPSCDVEMEPPYASSTRWARALELGIVSPSNLVLIGGRAAPQDAPARRVLDDLGAKAYSLADVERDRMATVAQEALEIAAAGTEAVYLSVDLAVMEGGRDPVGLSARELVVGVMTVASALLAAADVCGVASAPGGVGGPAAVAARVAAEIVAGVVRQRL